MPTLTREELARILIRAFHEGPSESIADFNESAMRAADAAIAALKGPVTGEELHNAIQAALRGAGLVGPLFPWSQVEKPMKTALSLAAATFAAPASTPCPDGWAEGWMVCAGASHMRGYQRQMPGCPPTQYILLPDTENGRVASHVLAGWRPSGDVAELKRLQALVELSAAASRRWETLAEQAGVELEQAKAERDEARLSAAHHGEDVVRLQTALNVARAKVKALEERWCAYGEIPLVPQREAEIRRLESELKFAQQSEQDHIDAEHWRAFCRETAKAKS